MTHRYIKIGVTTVVLVGAFAGLLWSTLRDGTEYYKHVDEVMASRQAWEGKALQLHGFVVPGSIFVTRDRLEYKFKVQNKGSVVTELVPEANYSRAEDYHQRYYEKNGHEPYCHVLPVGRLKELGLVPSRA